MMNLEPFRDEILPTMENYEALARAFDLGYEAGRTDCSKDCRAAQCRHAKRTLSNDCYGAWLDGLDAARESAHWSRWG